MMGGVWTGRWSPRRARHCCEAEFLSFVFLSFFRRPQPHQPASQPVQQAVSQVTPDSKHALTFTLTALFSVISD